VSTIGSKLKEAREAQTLSLDDVASATRINKKYLHALEEGKSIDLPDLYMKAFIKDYSEFLGVEVESSELPRKQDTSAVQGRIASTVTSQITTTNMRGSTAIKYPYQNKLKRGHQFRILAIITLIMLSCFVGILFWMQKDKGVTSTQEVKFSDVVKQWEAKKVDSSTSPFLAGGKDTVVATDTLVLEGAAVESTWVRIVIDGSEIKEYTLAPMGRIRCEGKQYFELSLDNARGIILTFNGKRIGTLSQMKKPMWNVTISPTTIERLQKMASGKG